MLHRTLNSKLVNSKKSILLLGPRQSGKSTLIKSFKSQIEINLADEKIYLDFAKNPSELRNQLAAKKKVMSVFIDEVQRLPNLLNTIQAIIDESHQGPMFYLTGSSARKLRRGKANLLPGRIHTYFIGPLTARELKYKMDTKKALSIGLLPGIWTDVDKSTQIKTLRSYASTYVKEEIQAEALTRNIEGFSRFLFVAAQESGKFLDLTKLSSEAATPRKTCQRFFEILEDTLLINRCPSFKRSARKRLIQHPKYFFFDTGVLNALLGNFTVSQDRIGNLFEHLIYNQILHSANALDKEIRISSYRTEHGAEIDFIVESDKKVFAVEVKASESISKLDLRGFKSFKEYYGKKHHPVIFYLGRYPKLISGIDVLPWQEGLKKLRF